MTRLKEELANLPAAFVAETLDQAQTVLAIARDTVQQVEAGYIQAITHQAELSGQQKALTTAIELAAGVTKTVAALEVELSQWTLLFKALSNDGVIVAG
jgi:hypothetical protein